MSADRSDGRQDAAASGVARRRWLTGGVAVCAAGLGGMWAWRQTASTPSAADDAVFGLRFASPDGGELVMSDFKGQPLLLNFWAPWCPPCLAELPDLVRFQRERAPAGWRVVGLAVDALAPVQKYLQNNPLGLAMGMAGAKGLDLSRQLGNTAGALPFTVLFDRKGQAIHRKLGPTSFDELMRWTA